MTPPTLRPAALREIASKEARRLARTACKRGAELYRNGADHFVLTQGDRFITLSGTAGGHQLSSAKQAVKKLLEDV
ncbi:MAG: hypothetical protein HC933_06395 [Pleurocapsa sp. SU_196_0]|nr:hypothetical protein [Pleurocapsa sp. SU_196_0]